MMQAGKRNTGQNSASEQLLTWGTNTGSLKQQDSPCRSDAGESVTDGDIMFDICAAVNVSDFTVLIASVGYEYARLGLTIWSTATL